MSMYQPSRLHYIPASLSESRAGVAGISSTTTRQEGTAERSRIMHHFSRFANQNDTRL